MLRMYHCKYFVFYLCLVTTFENTVFYSCGKCIFESTLSSFYAANVSLKRNLFSVSVTNVSLKGFSLSIPRKHLLKDLCSLFMYWEYH